MWLMGGKKFIARTVRFIGEQDGPPERTMKDRLSYALKQLEEPLRAYLCQVQYEGENQANVALCVATESALRNEIEETAIGVFQKIFNERTHLDSLFLTAAQEKEIEAVCRPFLVIT